MHPPSGALEETEADVRRDLEVHGGVLARLGGTAVAGLRFVREPQALHVRRLAVDPAYQGRGIGRALMEWVQAHARGQGLRQIRVGVRRELPGNRAFYERLGYQVVRERSHPGHDAVTWYEMRLEIAR